MRTSGKGQVYKKFVFKTKQHTCRGGANCQCFIFWLHGYVTICEPSGRTTATGCGKVYLESVVLVGCSLRVRVCTCDPVVPWGVGEVISAITSAWSTSLWWLLERSGCRARGIWDKPNVTESEGEQEDDNWHITCTKSSTKCTIHVIWCKETRSTMFKSWIYNFPDIPGHRRSSTFMTASWKVLVHSRLWQKQLRNTFKFLNCHFPQFVQFLLLCDIRSSAEWRAYGLPFTIVLSIFALVHAKGMILCVTPSFKGSWIAPPF